jgi:hypothetical protein
VLVCWWAASCRRKRCFHSCWTCWARDPYMTKFFLLEPINT